MSRALRASILARRRIVTVRLLGVPFCRPPVFGVPFGRPPVFRPLAMSIYFLSISPGCCLSRGCHKGCRFHSSGPDKLDCYESKGEMLTGIVTTRLALFPPLIHRVCRGFGSMSSLRISTAVELALVSPFSDGECRALVGSAKGPRWFVLSKWHVEPEGARPKLGPMSGLLRTPALRLGPAFDLPKADPELPTEDLVTVARPLDVGAGDLLPLRLGFPRAADVTLHHFGS